MDVNKLSEVTKDTFQAEGSQITNSLIKDLDKYPKPGLKYEQFNKHSLENVVNSDGSFSGNNVGSSQVGFMIFIADRHKREPTNDYSSFKSRTIVRAVLKAEHSDNRTHEIQQSQLNIV